MFFKELRDLICSIFIISSFSEGDDVDDAAEHAKLPLVPPYLVLHKHEFRGGANFASSGAGALVDTYKGYVSAILFLS